MKNKAFILFITFILIRGLHKCTFILFIYLNVFFPATGYDPMDICIENCAQCKKMLGSWFEGQLCAESCIKYKGKLIVECEDFASISPFLNKVARLPGKRG